MKDVKSYTISSPWKWEEYYAVQVTDYLREKGYAVRWRSKEELKLDTVDDMSIWQKLARKYIFFIDDDSGRFFAINHADQFEDMSEEVLSHPLCAGVLKCQYREGSYGQFENKVSPFVFGVKERVKYFSYKDEMEAVPHVEERMYFKGDECGSSGRWNVLRMLAKAGLINEDYGFRDENGKRDPNRLKISQKEYLRNMAKCKLILSLPGTGECCHREIEAFGMGVPVLMPSPRNHYYNDLIPDYHYAAVDLSSINEHKVRYFNSEEEARLYSMLKDKYYKIINDSDYLEELSKNAMKWFEENIMYPNNMKLMEHILLERFNYNL